MYTESFQDVFSFIQKYANIELTQEDFNSVLISLTQTNGNRTNLITFKKFISTLNENCQKNPSIPVLNQDYLLNDHRGILDLYHKHCLAISDGNTEQLFVELLYKCVSQNACKFASLFFGNPLKHDTFQNTIGRTQHASDLQALLHKSHKVIVWGEPQNGKTRFIKYCLTAWKMTDFYYIHHDNQNDIPTNLHQIQYINEFENKYWGSYLELKEDRFSSSLLVIDNMYNSPNLSADLELLAQLCVNVIIITHHHVETAGFSSYKLPNLSDEELLTVYNINSRFPISDSLLQKQLLETTNHNLLMLSLIATYMQKKMKQQEQSSSDILRDILKQLEYPNNHLSTPIRFKHEYTNYTKSLDIIGHLKVIYKNIIGPYDETAFISYMKFLPCFGSSPLPLEFLSYIIPDYNQKYLEELEKLELITLSNDYAQLSSSIFHAAFATEIPNPKDKDFETIVQNLIKFLENYDTTLSIPYLGNALLIFAQGLYNKVPFSNNQKQETTSKKFEKWQDLLYLIYYYYNQNGDFIIGEKIASMIHYPSSLLNAHSSLDISFFYLNNRMQSEDSLKQMLSQINSVASAIQKSHDLIPLTDTTLFFVNTLDLIIGLYCYIHLDLLTKTNHETSTKNDLFNYQNSLSKVMKVLLGYITHPAHDTKLHISNEKLQYYHLCYLQITGFPDYPESIRDNIVQLSNFLLWENKNYRIRATAFTLFMQSLHIYYIYSKNPTSSLPPLLETFNASLKPATNYLLEQIHLCRLLPIHTFKLCWYSFISVGIIEGCLFSINEANKQFIHSIFNADNIKDLISRTYLSKENLDAIFSEVENITSINF